MILHTQHFSGKVFEFLGIVPQDGRNLVSELFDHEGSAIYIFGDVTVGLEGVLESHQLVENAAQTPNI